MDFFRVILVFVIHLILTSYGQKKNAYQNHRLPKHIVPIKYTLNITTEINELESYFTGEVRIKMHIVKNTFRIILHCKNLNVSTKEVKVSYLTGDNEILSIPVLKHDFFAETDLYEILLGQRLHAGHYYLLYIPFSGELQEGLTGYYKSSYYDKTSETTKWMAVTQFEPTDARSAFPCFDEPALKAIFSIILYHDKEFSAISNMPVNKTKPMRRRTGWVMDTFDDTPPISTYLVAYMVSEMEYRDASRKLLPHVTFRIWARKDAIDQIELAKDVGPKFLSFYEKYFDINYPLPKQDMVALPDFSAGAMENWGLITYRESALLYYENQSSIFNKHIIAQVVSHELAHQWFGNLVTMKWWTDLWLNEGFATYLGTLAVNHIFPEWKSFDSERVNDLLTVFTLDSLKSSHPVSVPIADPCEIDQIFDTISYRKGCYLLHMMNNFLGKDVFKKGVKAYLKKHQYGNANQDDLWQSLTTVAREMGALDPVASMKTIMDTWTLQTGYPVIMVKRQYEVGSAIVSQERYLSSNLGLKKDKNKNNTCWWIPISYTTSEELDFNRTTPKTWLSCNTHITITSLPNQDEWVIFNVKASGLYRVNYDQHNWMLLGETLNDTTKYKTIDNLNRVQLIADMLALAWTNKLKYKMVLDTLHYLKFETEHLPWKTALNGFDGINTMLIRSTAYEHYKKYIRQLIEPAYKKLAANITEIPTDYVGINHHCMIVAYSCYYGIEDCENQTRHLFQNWFARENPQENNSIPTNLRRTVYCNVLKTTGEKYFMFLWQHYTRSNVATEKMLLLTALACTTDVSLLQTYLEWSLNPTRIRKQDSVLVFASVAHNEVGYPVAKQFLINNFEVIHKYHELKLSQIGGYIESIADKITSKEELTEFHVFVNSMGHKLRDVNISVRQGIETARNNVAWYSTHFQTVSRYLNEY